MYNSPLVCTSVGLPRLLAGTSFNCALPRRARCSPGRSAYRTRRPRCHRRSTLRIRQDTRSIARVRRLAPRSLVTSNASTRIADTSRAQDAQVFGVAPHPIPRGIIVRTFHGAALGGVCTEHCGIGFGLAYVALGQRTSHNWACGSGADPATFLEDFETTSCFRFKPGLDARKAVAATISAEYSQMPAR
jgi:hypothetical protein